MRRSITSTFSSVQPKGKAVKVASGVGKTKDKPPSKLKVLEQTNDLDEAFQDTFHTWDIGDDQSIATHNENRNENKSSFSIEPIPAPLLRGAPKIADDFSDEEITNEEKEAESKVGEKDDDKEEKENNEVESENVTLHEKRLRPMLSEEEIAEKEKQFRTLLQNTRSRLVASVFAFERIFDVEEKNVGADVGNKENDQYRSNRRRRKSEQQQTQKKALIFDQRTAIGFDARKVIKGSLLDEGNTVDDTVKKDEKDAISESQQLSVTVEDEEESEGEQTRQSTTDMEEKSELGSARSEVHFIHEKPIAVNDSVQSPSESTVLPLHTESVSSAGTVLISPTKRVNARHHSDPLVSSNAVLLPKMTSNTQTALMNFKVPKKLQEEIDAIVSPRESANQLALTSKDLEDEASMNSELTSLSQTILSKEDDEKRRRRPLSGKTTMSNIEEKILKLSSAPQYAYNHSQINFAIKHTQMKSIDESIAPMLLNKAMRSLSTPLLHERNTINEDSSN